MIKLEHALGVGSVLLALSCGTDSGDTSSGEGSATQTSTTTGTETDTDTTGGTQSGTATSATTDPSTSTGSGTQSETGSGTGPLEGCPDGEVWGEPGCSPPPNPDILQPEPGCYVECEGPGTECPDGTTCQRVWIEDVCPCPPWSMDCCEACGGAEAFLCA